MFIEVHILQNFSPSNLNRDDTGNPKDAEFGGVRRARISSQCIKRAIRQHPVFAEKTEVELADRTKWITRLLVKQIIQEGKPEEQAWEVAAAFANVFGVGTEIEKKTQRPKTKVLLYLSKSEINGITQKLVAQWDAVVSSLKNGKSPELDGIVKEHVKALKDRTSAPDIALFGRMLAEKPELNIDAACQVAHALSTHRVNMDIDYFTAVDDLATDEETGAGMLGVTAFNSACYYRYARVDWKQLVENLAGDKSLACKAVEGFLRAAVKAVPTGKQTGFAAQNPPDFILGVARTDGDSWSLANAFETPVRPGKEGGLVRASVVALDGYWGRLNQAYGSTGVKPFALYVGDEASLTSLKDAKVASLDQWIGSLLDYLPKE